MVDRAEEQRRVGPGASAKSGGSIAGGQLADPLGDLGDQLLGRVAGVDGAYHQTVESMSSSSSIGFV